MGTKLEDLQAKLERLQSQIKDEAVKEAAETALAEVRDKFTDAITAAVKDAEKSAGKTLREIGLGIWVAPSPTEGKGAFTVSALQYGDDGLPKAMRRQATRTGNGNGNGSGQEYEYFLKDGRGPFAGTLEALDAMNFPKDKRGQYYHRWDRLPKELQEAITRKPKAQATGDAANVGKNETGQQAAA